MCRLAPNGWKEKHEITEKSQQEVVVEETPAVGTKQQKSAWAAFLQVLSVTWQFFSKVFLFFLEKLLAVNYKFSYHS